MLQNNQTARIGLKTSAKDAKNWTCNSCPLNDWFYLKCWTWNWYYSMTFPFSGYTRSVKHVEICWMFKCIFQCLNVALTSRMAHVKLMPAQTWFQVQHGLQERQPTNPCIPCKKMLDYWIHFQIPKTKCLTSTYVVWTTKILVTNVFYMWRIRFTRHTAQHGDGSFKFSKVGKHRKSELNHCDAWKAELQLYL